MPTSLPSAAFGLKTAYSGPETRALLTRIHLSIQKRIYRGRLERRGSSCCIGQRSKDWLGFSRAVKNERILEAERRLYILLFTKVVCQDDLLFDLHSWRKDARIGEHPPFDGRLGADSYASRAGKDTEAKGSDYPPAAPREELLLRSLSVGFSGKVSRRRSIFSPCSRACARSKGRGSGFTR